MYILRTSKWLLEYLVLLFPPKRLLIFFWFCLVFRTSVWLKFYGLNYCVSGSRLFGRLVTVFVIKRLSILPDFLHAVRLA